MRKTYYAASLCFVHVRTIVEAEAFVPLARKTGLTATSETRGTLTSLVTTIRAGSRTSITACRAAVVIIGYTAQYEHARETSQLVLLSKAS
jgi:hypothetical protein